MTDSELKAWAVEALDDRIAMTELDDGQLRWEWRDKLVGGLMLTGHVMPAAEWRQARGFLERLKKLRRSFARHNEED